MFRSALRSLTLKETNPAKAIMATEMAQRKVRPRATILTRAIRVVIKIKGERAAVPVVAVLAVAPVAVVPAVAPVAAARVAVVPAAAVAREVAPVVAALTAIRAAAIAPAAVQVRPVLRRQRLQRQRQ
jgi:hypothetical protein